MPKQIASMKSLIRCSTGLLVLQFSLASLSARQILVQPQGRGATVVNDISNVRVGTPSADGTELVLTMDVIYDGLRGPSARIVPIISDRKNPQVSHWFGAETKAVGQGRSTVSVKIKFFNDEPGVPFELTTDRIRLMMLSESGNSVISESPVLKTVKWGNPNIKPVPLERAATVAVDEAKAAQLAAATNQAAQRAQAQAQEAQRQAEIKRQADEKAKADAEVKRIADDKAKADAEAKRIAALAEQQRVADEKARADAEAKRIADDKAKADAEAKRIAALAEQQRVADEKARADAEAKRIADERAKAEAAAIIAAVTPSTSFRAPSFALSKTAKTKVSNLDVVHRSLDRSEMTIGVEYTYAASDGLGTMGVDFASADDPAASTYFSSPTVEIGKSSRPFVLFPVKFNPASGSAPKSGSFGTDKVWVYLTGPAGEKQYISSATMLLQWHPPGGASGGPAAVAAARAGSQSTAQIEDFKQNNAFSGSVMVRYNLGVDSGRIHLRIYDSAKPESGAWFESEDVPIKSGPGLSLVNIKVPPESKGPAIFSADTIEITLLDDKDKVLATVTTKSNMSWAKPE